MKSAFIALFITTAFSAQSNSQTTETLAGHWDGSRAAPVHRLPLFDEHGQEITPTASNAMPISSANSCGSCHTYTVVSDGWHFNSSKNIVDKGRPGEPWIVTDRKTGTQLPLSYRGWKGTWHPHAVGMSDWDFTRMFARHLPGGDMAEPKDKTADPHARWEISGALEVNCLACHNNSAEQDPSEWARQVARENFRWAATAASGIGEVDGMAARLRDSWVPEDGPSRDDKEFAVAPSVKYNPADFDSKRRTVIDVARIAPDKNCQQCHSFVKPETERWHSDLDVHTQAGMRCADCHRNDLSHQMVRGYEGENQHRKDEFAEALTCRGCHIDNADGNDKQIAGRLGATNPKHAGIPLIHFEKLECTACHSGPMPKDEPELVRTSRANRLGIHGRAIWAMDMPYITEAVYMKNENGKIGPFRMMWPAFWARVEDKDKVVPLLPEKVAEAGKGILTGEDQVLKVLTALAAETETTGTPVFVANKKMFSRGKDGLLETEDYKGTRTISTALWGKRSGDELAPLIEEFDTTKDMDSEVESRIIYVLDVISRGEGLQETAIAVGNKIYKRDVVGTLVVNETSSTVNGMQLVDAAGGGATPLVTELELEAMTRLDERHSLTERQVAAMLRSLVDSTSTTQPGAQYAYVSSGKLFRLEGSDKLVSSAHKAAEPTAWPVGHDVRPARQSLGAKSCNECHSQDSPFFFAKIAATGPLMTQAAAVTPMHEFQMHSARAEQMLSASFTGRSPLKTLLMVTAGLIAIVLISVVFLGLRRLGSYIGPREG